MAVNTTPGLIHWVVEGTLVLAEEFVEMRSSNPSQPRDLSRKLILGAQSYADSWFASTQKVSHVEIYSTFLSVKNMESLTQGGSCVEESDYLAWGDMEWILHGQ